MEGEFDKDATSFIRWSMQELKKVSDKSKNIDELLKKISVQVIKHHIGAIIALHNTNIFSNFLNFCLLRDSKKMTEIAEIGYHCFFKYFNQYKPIFDQLDSKLPQEENDKMYTKYLGENKRYLEERAILKGWFELKYSKDENLSLLQRLNKFRQANIENFRPQGGFDQVFLVWLKREVEELQSNLHKNLKINNDDLCCRLQFKAEEVVKGVDQSKNIFISSTEKSKIGQNDYYKQYLRKQIIGFLNESGGVINIGANFDSKKCTIAGIALKEEERMTLLRFIIDVCFQILPQSERKEDQDGPSFKKRQEELRNILRQQIKRSLIEVHYQYQITRYVSVDFVPVYNSETLLYSEDPQLALYLLRIKVKPGDPSEVYHYINSKDTPQSTIREGNRTKEILFPEYYQEVYRRLKLKVSGKEIIKEPSHRYCRLFRRGELQRRKKYPEQKSNLQSKQKEM